MEKYIVILKVEGQDYPVKATAKNEKDAGNKVLKLFNKTKVNNGEVVIKEVKLKKDYSSPYKISHFGASSLEFGGRVLGSTIK